MFCKNSQEKLTTTWPFGLLELQPFFPGMKIICTWLVFVQVVKSENLRLVSTARLNLIKQTKKRIALNIDQTKIIIVFFSSDLS